MDFPSVHSKPSTVEPEWTSDGLPSARMMKLGASPNRYRPAPSLQKLLVISRKFLATSKFPLTETPPPVLVKCCCAPRAGGWLGLKVFTVSSTPATSKCTRELGSKAILLMMSGCTWGRLIPLTTLASSSVEVRLPRAAGSVGTPPPPEPPKYCEAFSAEMPQVTLLFG